MAEVAERWRTELFTHFMYLCTVLVTINILPEDNKI